MNAALAEIIFRKGADLRNPGIFTKVAELKTSDFSTKADFTKIQDEKLSAMFAFFKKHAAFYKDYFLDADLSKPREVFNNLPILEKSTLHAHANQMQCYAAVGKLFDAETSGSTGQPFKFKKDLVWDSYHRASILRSYQWYNVSPWERNGYFWGYNFSKLETVKTSFLDGLQNRFRVFDFNKDNLKQFLTKLKDARYLHGYSSMIYEVAQIAIELGFSPKDFPHLKMVKGTSEKIYDYYHAPVLTAFGHKMISEYGSAEGGIMAFECPQGNMHVNEENVILEVVDGNAVVTNLNAFSLPILRFNIGDAISIDNETQCSCGRQSAIVKEVVGRVGKKIMGKTQTYPSLTLYYVFKNIANNTGNAIQYQGFQQEAGKMQLRFSKELSSAEKKLITAQCQSYFLNDLEIEFIEQFDLNNRKSKLKDFITEIA